ncbi:hypothetical protein SAMN04487948_11412 [Halogranum amylolyticum]|uniref:Uncharacterized protein n=1 Tax=Halogranum amylolyticum TaxID=660520 RepID=A0A1H8V3N8_9EURY|nr:hypothetical protein SAMN04487948_11412 [Halogranum amylolyticum]
MHVNLYSFARPTAVDDDDVATFDLRDTVTLLTERLDRDLTELTLIDGRPLLCLWRRVRGGVGGLTRRRRGSVREHVNTIELADVEFAMLNSSRGISIRYDLPCSVTDAVHRHCSESGISTIGVVGVFREITVYWSGSFASYTAT